jgi:deoxyribodipyrimidine photo-lyase
MYYHLIDADPAINYAQWQMQCGLVGCHPNRIYNPRKQVRENDPDGEFVRGYIPELWDLPSEFLPRPERTPLHAQRECGVEIGTGPDATYPRPVVDFEHEATLAREQFGRLAEPAREALVDPVVRRRASLSRKRRQRSWELDEGGETEGDSRQGRLSSY